MPGSPASMTNCPWPVRGFSRAVADILTQELKAKRQNDKALAIRELQKVIHVEVQQAGQALRAVLGQALTHHLCLNPACVSCKPRVAAIRADTIDKIEDRVPGTREGLESYEALNKPVASLRFQTNA